MRSRYACPRACGETLDSRGAEYSSRGNVISNFWVRRRSSNIKVSPVVYAGKNPEVPSDERKPAGSILGAQTLERDGRRVVIAGAGVRHLIGLLGSLEIACFLEDLSEKILRLENRCIL